MFVQKRQETGAWLDCAITSKENHVDSAIAAILATKSEGVFRIVFAVLLDEKPQICLREVQVTCHQEYKAKML